MGQRGPPQVPWYVYEVSSHTQTDVWTPPNAKTAPDCTRRYLTRGSDGQTHRQTLQSRRAHSSTSPASLPRLSKDQF
jgi:hypothetical protein